MHQGALSAEDMKVLGQQYFLNRNYEKAVASFQGALAKAEDPGARLLLAKSFYGLGRFRETVDNAVIVYGRTGDKDTAKVLALGHFGLREWDKALVYLDRISAEATEIPVLNLAAECHMNLGRYDQALALLKKSLSLVPDQPAIRELEEKVVKISGEAERSHEMSRKMSFFILMSALTVSLSLAQIQGKIDGEVSDETGKPINGVSVTIISQKTASMHFEMSTDKDGRFRQVGLMPGYFIVNFKKEGFGPVAREVKVSIAEVATLHVTMKTTAAMDQKALSAADRTFLKGNALYSDQKYEEAIVAYREAIANDGSNWGYYLNLGLACKKMNRLEDAPGGFPQGGRARAGELQRQQGAGRDPGQDRGPGRGQTFLRKGLDPQPRRPGRALQPGTLPELHGEPLAALGHFEAAVKLKPDFAEPYYEMGTVLIGPEPRPGGPSPPCRNSWSSRPTTRKPPWPGSLSII